MARVVFGGAREGGGGGGFRVQAPVLARPVMVGRRPIPFSKAGVPRQSPRPRRAGSRRICAGFACPLGRLLFLAPGHTGQDESLAPSVVGR